MRKINLILANAAIAAALLMSSCKPDSEDETTAAVGPSVSLLNSKNGDLGESNPTFQDETVLPSAKLTFRVQSTKGDKNLKTVEITAVKGDKLDLGEVKVDGKVETDNPFNVSNNNVDVTIDLTAPSTEGVVTYTFTVTDGDGVKASKSVKVTIDQDKNSPKLTTNSGFKIYNLSGLSKGSFDFDALATVSSSDASGDIQDLGNNSTKGDLQAGRLQAQELWQMKFQAENSANVKSISKADYDNATSKADIERMFAANEEIKQQDVKQLAGVASPSSYTYAKDGTYAVKTASGNYAVFMITAVTPLSSNEDYATFTTKSVVTAVR